MMEDMEFSFETAGKIIFGAGKRSSVGIEAAALGSRVLLVAGKGSLRRAGVLAEIERHLAEQSLDVRLFDQVLSEPPLEAVEEGIEAARSHDSDVIVAVGGGSVIDVGKAVAGLTPAPSTVHDYFQGREVEEKGLRLIAMPTTAGSGAEVTANAVLTDTERAIKASIRSPHLLPDVAIVDPELTLSLPPDVTAHSGMDALCQAIEGLVSKGANPLTDVLAGDAAVRLIRCLRQAYEDGQDLELRTQVALGSLMSAIAFANSRLGLVHGMAHPLGVTTGLPHGLICAILLPEVIRFNLPVSGAKYARLAREAGLIDSEAPDEPAVRALIRKIERLNTNMGIDARRAELRVPLESWASIVTQSLASGSTKSNPRPVGAEDVEAVLSAL